MKGSEPKTPTRKWLRAVTFSAALISFIVLQRSLAVYSMRAQTSLRITPFLYRRELIFAIALPAAAIGLVQMRQVNLQARWRFIAAALFTLLGSWELWRNHGWRSIWVGPLLFGVGGFCVLIALERAFSREQAQILSFRGFFSGLALSHERIADVGRGVLLGTILAAIDGLLVLSAMALHFAVQDERVLRAVNWLHAQHLRPFHALMGALLVANIAALLALYTQWLTPARASFAAAVIGAAALAHPSFNALAAIQPDAIKLAVLTFECLLLQYLLRRYGLLTMIATVATAQLEWWAYRL